MRCGVAAAQRVAQAGGTIDRAMRYSASAQVGELSMTRDRRARFTILQRPSRSTAIVLSVHSRRSPPDMTAAQPSTTLHASAHQRQRWLSNSRSAVSFTPACRPAPAAANMSGITKHEERQAVGLYGNMPNAAVSKLPCRSSTACQMWPKRRNQSSRHQLQLSTSSPQGSASMCERLMGLLQQCDKGAVEQDLVCTHYSVTPCSRLDQSALPKHAPAARCCCHSAGSAPGASRGCRRPSSRTPSRPPAPTQQKLEFL